MTLSDLAKLFNVPVPIVRNYIVKGLPHQQDGELLYFDLRESVAWFREYSTQQLKEFKSGRASQQTFLRELLDGQEIIDDLYGISRELSKLYDEVTELGEKFQGANQYLLDVKGKLDPGKMKVDAMLDSNRQSVINAKVKLLESRRSGLESLLRKKLPDLKVIDVGLGKGGEDSEVEQAMALWKAAASES